MIGYRHKQPDVLQGAFAYAMIDEDIVYLSPITIYSILKRNNLLVEWKRPLWESTRPEHTNRRDERGQTDIMYVKINGRFFYPLIFIDEYSRYIVNHSLLTSMDDDSATLEAQNAIDYLRKDFVAEPVIQRDNGSSFNAMEFKPVPREIHLTQKLIKPHTTEQNGIVERANKTMREYLVPVILADYEQAKTEISWVVQHYNNERRRSSLQYLTPIHYYRGEPDVLLAIREAKIEKARALRREENMTRRKLSETAGTVS